MNGTIGVLCGGPSHEREISLRSGQAIHQALQSLGLPSRLTPLSSDPAQIPAELHKANLARAFIALHGWFGEDGTIQSLLEQMNIPYTGSSVEACRYAMDKVHSRRKWAAAGLPVPRWILADPYSAISKASRMGFPLVVKPQAEGSSFGISIVDSPAEVPQALEQAATYAHPAPASAGEQILLEEFLPGPELTVGILQDRPLPVIQIVPRRRFYDYVAKYTPGQTQYLVPAPIPEPVARAVQDLAFQAHEALGCRSFSRADLILVQGRGPVLLELNAVPGMTPLSLLPKAAQSAGISFPELCRQMLASAEMPLPVGLTR